MSDLLIMGSGVVGNFAAAYFRRYFPSLRVTVVGRSDQELPIVGESLVELSTHFLQDLGLSRYLIEQHLPKYGLTYYYKLDPSRPRDPSYIVDEAPSNPPFPSFLINRFSFDAELRRLNRQKGVRCIQGKVTGVNLGNGAPHRVTVQRADGREEPLEARWLVDATGRRRLLARHLGLQSKAPHQRSAFWFRLVDFDASILDRIHAVKKVNRSYDSYFCTHHFFGQGNWVWLIPVRSEDSRRMISIGLTYRPDLFPGSITCTEEFLDWMAREHPVVGDFVKSGEIVDTNVYRNYMYRARQRYSSQGWFLIGDAADTVDPLYSTGLALASLSIQQVGAMVRRDMEGRLSEAFVADLDRAYAGVHGTAGDMVGTLYEAMQDGFQCHMRMNLNVSTMFHLAIPLILNGYYTDSVGARLAARFGGPEGMIRKLRTFEPLIARAAKNLNPPSPEHFIKVQSSFTLNFPYFEYHREEDIPRSISQMFRHMTALRLRLLRLAGMRSWFDRVQLGALAQTFLWAVAVGCFGRRSLKNSGLIRWMVAPKSGRLRRGASGPPAAGHTKQWLRKIAERLPVSRRLRLP